MATTTDGKLDRGTKLALVAMAQTLPVLTRGLDLSVGMVFIMANCIASTIVVETKRIGRSGLHHGQRELRDGAQGRAARGAAARKRRRGAAEAHTDAASVSRCT